MGSEAPGLKLPVALFTLLFLNAFYFSYIFFINPEPQLGWSRDAAARAEDVASLLCSGHGRVFLDSPVIDGRPSCECNSCYAGTDCSQLLQDCPADAARFCGRKELTLKIYKDYSWWFSECVRD